MDKYELAEYKDIEDRAKGREHSAQVQERSNPRGAQVHATLAVSARLEALAYVLRHQPVRDLCPDCSHPDRP